MVLWRRKNAARHNILSLCYLGLTLHTQKGIFNCDRKKICCHHSAFLSQISARSKKLSTQSFAPSVMEVQLPVEVFARDQVRVWFFAKESMMHNLKITNAHVMEVGQQDQK